MNEELLHRMSILYVEDDAITRKNLGRYLERRVQQLYTASDGQEGLDLYKEHRPDIVVTDIKMPRMDGLTMVRRIREINPSTPVVLTTAYSDVDYLMRAIDIGVDKFVKKPIVNEQVHTTLEQIAVVLQHEYEVQKRNHIIETVLDWHPCFVIWTSAGNLNYINSRLLNFMGYSSPDDFFERHQHITEVIRHSDGFEFDRDSGEEWFHHIINSPDKDHRVYLRNRDTWHESEFIIRFHHFENTDMYIFAFLDPDMVDGVHMTPDALSGFCK